jgi:BirA family biotin operon repressor/biotin-[acetyl-CoA-carboxylase] ligase
MNARQIKQLASEPAVKLHAQSILDLRDGDGLQVDVEVVDETGSTNADLMARLDLLQTPLLRVAEHQTAGRGRAGRVWHSVSGGVLTFSLAWYFSGNTQSLLGLPLVTGVAIAEALAALGVNVGLKWPNDVLKDQKKLAGILIETSAPKYGGSWAVIGIGLNLSVPDDLEVSIGHEVADAPWLAQMDRNALMAHLLNALAKTMQQFGQSGFVPFAERWNTLHVYAGREVVITDAGMVVQRGIALGVDRYGCLLLQTTNGQIPVISGDVSLRLA